MDPDSKAGRVVMAIGLLFGGFIAVSALSTLFYGKASEREALKAAAPVDPAAAARGACRVFVERSLHDPSRADWEPSWEWQTVGFGAGEYSVGVKLRAPNRYGAMVKTFVTCQVKAAPDGSWTLVKLTKMY